MRKVLITVPVLCLLLFVFVQATVSPALQTGGLKGAWGYGNADNKNVMIFSGNVFAVAKYDIAGKKFLHSFGGTWQAQDSRLVRKIEWDSRDSSQVGKEWTNDLHVKGNALVISDEKWERLDDGSPGKLAGAWIITGNYNNDKVSKRGSPFYPRRTMKVLSGKYFHWIAYNVVTKQFLAAGGGTYTTENGKYTEQIEFFTKTAASVGKTLVFDYSFDNGDWRHKGEKSTGGAMDECWSRRETME